MVFLAICKTFKNDYNTIDLNVILDNTTTSGTITAAQLANNSTIFIRATNTTSSPLTVTVDIEFDSSTVPTGFNNIVWRQVRQRYQFQKIPINFRVSTVFFRLTGNITLVTRFNGVNFPSQPFTNEFYRIAPNTTPTATNLRYYGEFFIAYGAADDAAFSASPYYNEPLTCYPPVLPCYSKKKCHC